MSTTQPIRNLKQLETFKRYYEITEPHPRNCLLIHLGINTALRISDLLHLTWSDVYDFDTKALHSHLNVMEQKTGKKNSIALNNNARLALNTFFQITEYNHPSDFLFQGKNRNQPLSRYQAYRIIKKAATHAHLQENISCHSLRKTFGYHAWKSGAQPVLLMNIYNHSSFQITKHYLGIDQDDKDQIFLDVNL